MEHVKSDPLPTPSAETAKVARRALPPVMLLVTFLALVIFAYLSTDLAVTPERGVIADDSAISSYLMNHSIQSAIDFWLAVTLLGNGLPIVLITALAALFLAMRKRYALAVGLVMTAATGQLVNEVLKLLFHRARPVWTPGYTHPSGFSFPSGHAMGSMIIYGFMIYALLTLTGEGRWRYFVAAFFALLIVLVGVSRIVLGAHWLTDVMGGWAAGLVWLVLCIYVADWMRQHRPWNVFYQRWRRTPRGQ